MIKNLLNALGRGLVWLFDGTKQHGVYLATVVVVEYATFNYVKTALSAFGSSDIATAVAVACVGGQIICITAIASGKKDVQPESGLIMGCGGLLTWVGAMEKMGTTMEPGEVLFALLIAFTLFMVRLAILFRTKPE